MSVLGDRIEGLLLDGKTLSWKLSDKNRFPGNYQGVDGTHGTGSCFATSPVLCLIAVEPVGEVWRRPRAARSLPARRGWISAAQLASNRGGARWRGLARPPSLGHLAAAPRPPTIAILRGRIGRRPRAARSLPARRGWTSAAQLAYNRGGARWRGLARPPSLGHLAATPRVPNCTLNCTLNC